MLDRLLKIEEHVARAEAVLLVVFVGLMLGLATYNVFYRNVLVPIQVDLLTEDVEPDAEPGPSGKSGAQPAAETADEESKGDDGAAGFGGGFGEGDDSADDGAAGFGGGFEEGDGSADDGAAGFGGGFDEEKEKPKEAPKEEPADDGAAGFAGGFGDDESGDATDDGAAGFAGGFGEADEQAGGFGGDFAESDEGESTDDLTTSDVGVAEEKEEPWLARFIDAIKLEWIDQVLRQLVLVVGFLGAMLATRRRKHITIDALSKVLSEKQLHWAHLVTNSVSIIVCLLLTKAGKDLVSISLEYPKEIVWWADEWMFQLVFPVGFGMLALHFTIRWIETLYYALGKAEPRPLAKGGEL